MALKKTKVEMSFTYINYSDLEKEVEKRLSEREGRVVKVCDYAGQEDARNKAFAETNKLGDMSWWSTPFTQYTPVQQKQHDIYRSFTDNIPQQNFWQWWIDIVDDEIRNDYTTTVWWRYEDFLNNIEEGDEFIKVILEVFNEVILETFTKEELDNGIKIHYFW